MWPFLNLNFYFRSLSPWTTRAWAMAWSASEGARTSPLGRFTTSSTSRPSRWWRSRSCSTRWVRCSSSATLSWKLFPTCAPSYTNRWHPLRRPWQVHQFKNTPKSDIFMINVILELYLKHLTVVGKSTFSSPETHSTIIIWIPHNLLIFFSSIRYNRITAGAVVFNLLDVCKRL